jgi:hypothetical protein
MEELMYEESAGGFIEWINMYGNTIYFIGQIVFWLGLLVLIGYAVFQYKRWVNYQLGTGKSGALRKAEESDEAAPKKAAEKVSVDKFVE